MLMLACTLGREAHWHQILKDGLDPSAQLSDEQAQDVAAHPEFADTVRRLRAGELAEKKERVDAFALARYAKYQRDGTNAYWLERFGFLHRLRMQATYVDVGDEGEVLAGPSTISPEAAELPIIGAAVLLGFAIKLFLRDRVDDFVKSFQYDLTGQRLLMPWVEAFQRVRAEPEMQKHVADPGAA